MNNEMSRRSFVERTGGALLGALSNRGTAPSAAGHQLDIEKFRIAIPESVMADLRVRLKNTRWNDAVTDD